jgi:hypothetical protein
MSAQLFDAFAVCGLPPEPLCSITGETGYQGLDARYRPSITDSVATQGAASAKNEQGGAKLPTHFAMV